MPADGGIGAPNKRREDVRFLTGKGKYTDDLNRPGQAHVIFVRSQVAHGNLVAVNTDEAAAMPGVIRIFTGADFAEVGGLPCGWQVTDKHGQPMQEPAHPVLAQGKVRHVGDAIAAVVAETADQARDAAEAVEVEIDELPAVVDMKAALAADAPKVHDDLTSNLCYDWGFVEENKAAVEEAFANAAHVTTLELVNNRLVANPMEPRVAIGDFRCGERGFNALHHQPEPPCDPPAHGRFRVGHSRTQAARSGAGCRGRVRLENLPLCRGSLLHIRRQGAGAAGQVDLVPVRGLHHRCPWPRSCDHDPAGAGCGEQLSPPFAPIPTRTWGPTCRPSHPRCRPGCMAR